MYSLYSYYVKGRVFEWTMALGMTLAGAEMVWWTDVLTFGAFHWMMLFIGQKWIGSLMLFIGWIRICSLFFNGQYMFGLPLGLVLRGFCSVFCAALWFQFAIALLELSINQGFPSVGLPFWSMFILAELTVTYGISAEWTKQ